MSSGRAKNLYKTEGPSNMRKRNIKIFLFVALIGFLVICASPKGSDITGAENLCFRYET
jgi:hypothetical protein